jgi:hypothetical protein
LLREALRSASAQAPCWGIGTAWHLTAAAGRILTPVDVIPHPQDGKRLTALAADAPSAAPVPAVRFVWAPKSKPLPTPAYLPAPLYRAADRQKVLFEVQLPLAPGEPADAWVLAGVALFVSS